jgi:hypothetical protein
MVEMQLASPGGYNMVLGPGATWERGLSKNLTMWQIPGQGVDGMDLWLDSDSINISFPIITDITIAGNYSKNMVNSMINEFITNQSTMGDKKTYTLTYPLGTATGFIRNMSFSQKGGEGDIIQCQFSLEVIHVT